MLLSQTYSYSAGFEGGFQLMSKIFKTYMFCKKAKACLEVKGCNSFFNQTDLMQLHPTGRIVSSGLVRGCWETLGFIHSQYTDQASHIPTFYYNSNAPHLKVKKVYLACMDGFY